jgi:PTS system galactitol-specific IIA component
VTQDFVIDERLVDLQIAETDRDGVLRRLCNLLVEEGLASDTYADAIVEREASHPTGLQFEGIAIGLPHAGSSHVRKSGIALGRTPTPISFQRMDDPSVAIPVDLIVMLSLQDPERHVPILAALIGFLADAESARRVREATSAEELCVLFRQGLSSATATGEQADS